MFDNSTILITGGTGSWGYELTTQILKQFKPRQLRIYSRGEHNQVNMHRRFGDDPRLRFVIGDVRDLDRLTFASQGVDYLFHLAALKHVPVCEENPYEAVRTNVIGTQNVIEAALANKVKRVVDVSSDKAASPLNLYGTTKAVGEKLIISANLMSQSTVFVCVRAGNVLGTQGSVVPLFRNQILNTNSVTITDGTMTRFFMNLDKVISLLFGAVSLSVGGEIFVVPMPAASIDDLADVMISALGDKKSKKNVIGRRPGEKVHELLVSVDEAERTHILGDYNVILPTIKLPAVEMHYRVKKLKRIKDRELSSENAHRLTKAEIHTMLSRENWLSSKKLPSDVVAAERSDILAPFEKEGWVRKKK